jgi:hypothetical protein
MVSHGSSVGIGSGYRLNGRNGKYGLAKGPLSLLYRSVPGREADEASPSTAEVTDGKSALPYPVELEE